MGRSANYSLVLLAGGKSSRMGQDKAQMKYKGKTFMECQLAKAEKLGITNVYLSGHAAIDENSTQMMQGYVERNVQVVWDIYPERGPLGGIHACMNVMKTPYCLVLPVDVPQIPVRILEKMIRFHEANKQMLYQKYGKEVPVLLSHGDREEPLLAVYPASMMKEMEAVVRVRAASVYKFDKVWGYEVCRLEFPDWFSSNINTYDIYTQILECEKNDAQKINL